MPALRTIGPALAILVLSAVAPAQDNDLPKFAGKWTVTAAELGGEKAGELIGATFEFSKDTAQFTQKAEDGTVETDAHPFKVDTKSKRVVLYQAPDPMNPSADPKAGMQRGIYQFAKSGALVLCLTEPDAAAFPAKFESKTDEADFLMLKLEKAKADQTAAKPKAAAPR